MAAYTVTPEMKSPGRVWFIDALRSSMMMLGVVYHSSLVYNGEHWWLVDSGHSVPALSYLTSAIHVFRLPTFFLISGFFCFLTFWRLGVATFLSIVPHAPSRDHGWTFPAVYVRAT